VHGKRCSNRPGSEHPCPTGLVCVESPVPPSGDLEGICYEASSAVPCPKGTTFCTKNASQGIDWVVKCQDDGYSSTVDTDCAEFDPPLTCNADSALCAQTCPEGENDCPADHTCDTGTWLCRPFAPCNAACAPDPQNEAVTSDPTSLDCFGVVTDPGTQVQATIRGRVYFFPTKNSKDTVGLQVLLHPNGDPDTALKTCTVFEDRCDTFPDPDAPCGYYEFTEVDTNRTYDLEIRQPQEGYTGDPIATTVQAGITVRSDRLDAGMFSLSLNAMSAQSYSSYTTSLVDNYDARRGLLIGRVLDCGDSQGDGRLPIGNATVGLAADPVSPGRMYYFPNRDVLAPDPSLSATTVKGYYVAVGVPACRNQVGFSAREVSELFLGAVNFTMRPGYVVIIDNPHPMHMPYP
jgi:hypothetical protein